MAESQADTPTSTAREIAIIAEFAALAGAACPSCRYNLRGLTSPMCPECGVPLALTVAARSGGASGWWWSAVLGTSFALSIAIWLFSHLCRKAWLVVDDPTLPAMAAAGFASSRDLPNWTAILTLTIAISALLALLAILLARRRGFLRLHWSIRAMVGLAAMMSPLALLLAVRWGSLF